ncbi:MAG: carboxypeptidase-like regulatory domain-containing protein, partial [Polyangiaceae bacterium]
MKAWWLVVAGGLAAACSSSVPPASQTDVRNTCKTNADCTGYRQDGPLTCTRGQCVTSGAILSVARLQSTPYPYALAISMPPTASYQPGTTVVVQSADLALYVPTDAIGLCNGDATTHTCVQLPSVGFNRGLYDVDPQTAKDVGRYVGGTEATLPVHATYTLLTSDPTTATTQESTGIPVYSTFATLTNAPIVVGQPGGPGGAPPIDFTANLPPGRYRRDIQVDPPFDDSFPPWSDLVTIGPSLSLPVKVGATSDYINQNYIQPLTPRFVAGDNVTPAGHFVCAGNDCTGWTASLVDVKTGRLRSNVHTFHTPSGGDFSLFTVTPKQNVPIDGLTGQALLLAPPAGPIWPSIFSVAVQGVIAGEQSYPAVQIAAVVQGHVTTPPSVDASANGVPVKAVVDFASNDEAFQLLYGNKPLVYRTSVITDAAGFYSVSLPRGSYDVAVTPDPSSAPLAVTYSRVDVLTTSPGGTDNYIQTGSAFDFVVRPPMAVTGQVTLSDGRPLGGIVVEASRALGASTPNVPPKLVDLARSTRTKTDATGAYSLPLDPGTYDISVETPPSAGYAWGVAPASVVVAPGASPP